jgi:hypothetical protein
MPQGHTADQCSVHARPAVVANTAEVVVTLVQLRHRTS